MAGGAPHEPQQTQHLAAQQPKLQSQQLFVIESV